MSCVFVHDLTRAEIRMLGENVRAAIHQEKRQYPRRISWRPIPQRLRRVHTHGRRPLAA